MKLYLALITALLTAACEPQAVSLAPSGEPRPIWLLMNPLCLFGCPSTLGITGSIIGEGAAGSNSQSPSQSVTGGGAALTGGSK